MTEQRHGLLVLHGVHFEQMRADGHRIGHSRGDQSRAALAALQEWPSVGGVPDIVDDDQDVAVREQIDQGRRSRVQARKSWPLAAQDEDQILNPAHQAPRFFTQGDPQDAVVERRSYFLVVTDGARKHRLAVTACTAQRRDAGDRFAALAVDQ